MQLFDFARVSPGDWEVVNDGVMGELPIRESQGSFSTVPTNSLAGAFTIDALPPWIDYKAS